ncbi:ubiquinol-cytochrome-c reductase complex subunit 7 [Schizosaccharomyces japonicus yFS275]|uniref:Cytochrome b-c1 complex subunit 8 n=1 Tax=Schizosaccharomyces japonicus (strain yFS275 / FY16936) TaxID=402676 RepID=B6JUY1_SCHJY|nr:ubiquinol-cytochrome-c reductase complex subunit 7 [Schizosaccharomyces japonicus yFS275]EEB05085.1 ubiquinol-cytochrome-c reductase complex subunit 7 [Schizosaccharomyces japonicus yFS275]
MGHAPSGKTYLGWWGALGGPKQKGIITYTVSPFQQRPMAGLLSSSFRNGFRTFKSNALYILIPMGSVFYLMHWANKKNEYINSKKGVAETHHAH